VPAGEAFTPDQRRGIDKAIRAAKDASGYEFSVYVGAVEDESRPYALRLHTRLPGPDNSVLVLVDPSARCLEIVTGARVRRDLDDAEAALVALSMQQAFAAGYLSGGISAGVYQLGEHARIALSMPRRWSGVNASPAGTRPTPIGGVTARRCRHGISRLRPGLERRPAVTPVLRRCAEPFRLGPPSQTRAVTRPLRHRGRHHQQRDHDGQPERDTDEDQQRLQRRHRGRVRPRGRGLHGQHGPTVASRCPRALGACG
jgi:hypothetical protein